MIDTVYEEYEKLCMLEGVNPIEEMNKKWYEHYMELKQFYGIDDMKHLLRG